MGLLATVYPMIDRPETQLTLQTVKGIFQLVEHHIKGPQFLFIQVGAAGANVVGTGEHRGRINREDRDVLSYVFYRDLGFKSHIDNIILSMSCR